MFNLSYKQEEVKKLQISVEKLEAAKVAEELQQKVDVQEGLIKFHKVDQVPAKNFESD